MKCKQVQEWLLAYLDGEVTPGQRSQIEAHLAQCPDCAAERDALAALKAELSATMQAAADQIQLPAAAEARIVSHLEKRLSKRALPGPLPALGRWWRSHSWALARALVILMVGALVAASLYVTQVAPGALPPRRNRTGRKPCCWAKPASNRAAWPRSGWWSGRCRSRHPWPEQR